MKKLAIGVTLAVIAIFSISSWLRSGDRVSVPAGIPYYNSNREERGTISERDSGEKLVLNRIDWGVQIRLDSTRDRVWVDNDDLLATEAPGPKPETSLTKVWKFLAPLIPLIAWGVVVGLLWYYMVKISPAKRLEKIIELTWKPGTGAKAPVAIRAHQDPDPVLAQKAEVTGIPQIMDLIMDQVVAGITAAAGALQPWEAGMLNRAVAMTNSKLARWKKSGFAFVDYVVEPFDNIREELGFVTDSVTIAGTIDQDPASATLIEAHAGGEAALRVLRLFSEMTGEQPSADLAGRLEALTRSQAWNTFARAAAELVGDIDLNKLADLLAERRSSSTTAELKQLIASALK